MGESWRDIAYISALPTGLHRNLLSPEASLLGGTRVAYAAQSFAKNAFEG
jgi:hypothetical protein